MLSKLNLPVTVQYYDSPFSVVLEEVLNSCTCVQVRVQEVPLGATHTALLGLLHRDHAHVLATASGLAPAVVASGLLDVRPLQAAIQVRGL